MSWIITPEFALPDEPEALAYIAAVEAADGEALEPAVRLAINSFVKGCKADGIWSAIKASCILAGARTLAGALVPLVGTAPTNNGPFVSADYDRKTGLKGNATTKYLNSNRAGNADPVNNEHHAVFASEASSGGAYTQYLSAGFGVGPYKGLSYDTTGANLGTYGSSNSNNALGTTGTQIANFLGISRASSTTVNFRRSGTTVSISDNSISAPTSNLGVYALNGSSGSNFSDARLAFYSIGESLDLAKLDGRVTALVSALSTAIP